MSTFKKILGFCECTCKDSYTEIIYFLTVYTNLVLILGIIFPILCLLPITPLVFSIVYFSTTGSRQYAINEFNSLVNTTWKSEENTGYSKFKERYNTMSKSVEYKINLISQPSYNVTFDVNSSPFLDFDTISSPEDNPPIDKVFPSHFFNAILTFGNVKTPFKEVDLNLFLEFQTDGNITIRKDVSVEVFTKRLNALGMNERFALEWCVVACDLSNCKMKSAKYVPILYEERFKWENTEMQHLLNVKVEIRSHYDPEVILYKNTGGTNDFGPTAFTKNTVASLLMGYVGGVHGTLIFAFVLLLLFLIIVMPFSITMWFYKKKPKTFWRFPFACFLYSKGLKSFFYCPFCYFDKNDGSLLFFFIFYRNKNGEKTLYIFPFVFLKWKIDGSAKNWGVIFIYYNSNQNERSLKVLPFLFMNWNVSGGSISENDYYFYFIPFVFITKVNTNTAILLIPIFVMDWTSKDKYWCILLPFLFYSRNRNTRISRVNMLRYFVPEPEGYTCIIVPACLFFYFHVYQENHNSFLLSIIYYKNGPEKFSFALFPFYYKSVNVKEKEKQIIVFPFFYVRKSENKIKNFKMILPFIITYNDEELFVFIYLFFFYRNKNSKESILIVIPLFFIQKKGEDGDGESKNKIKKFTMIFPFIIHYDDRRLFVFIYLFIFYRNKNSKESNLIVLPLFFIQKKREDGDAESVNKIKKFTLIFPFIIHFDDRRFFMFIYLFIFYRNKYLRETNVIIIPFFFSQEKREIGEVEYTNNVVVLPFFFRFSKNNYSLSIIPILLMCSYKNTLKNIHIWTIIPNVFTRKNEEKLTDLIILPFFIWVLRRNWSLFSIPLLIFGVYKNHLRVNMWRVFPLAYTRKVEESGQLKSDFVVLPFYFRFSRGDWDVLIIPWMLYVIYRNKKKKQRIWVIIPITYSQGDKEKHIDNFVIFPFYISLSSRYWSFFCLPWLLYFRFTLKIINDIVSQYDVFFFFYWDFKYSGWRTKIIPCFLFFWFHNSTTSQRAILFIPFFGINKTSDKRVNDFMLLLVYWSFSRNRADSTKQSVTVLFPLLYLNEKRDNENNLLVDDLVILPLFFKFVKKDWSALVIPLCLFGCYKNVIKKEASYYLIPFYFMKRENGKNNFVFFPFFWRIIKGELEITVLPFFHFALWKKVSPDNEFQTTFVVLPIIFRRKSSNINDIVIFPLYFSFFRPNWDLQTVPLLLLC